jgi:MYXO-CTERM domain-containing protein
MRIRKSAALLAAASMIAISGPAHARTTDIGKKTAAEVKEFCDGVAGGKFTQSPDGKSYACTSECTGGTCHVQCDADTGCDVSIPRRPVPTGTDPRLDKFVKLAPDLQDAEDDNRDFPLGLIGLVGLAGLLGLRRSSPRIPDQT